MGRSKVDGFARFIVLPQTGHGLSGNNYATDGDGKQIESNPNAFDRFALLVDWVENGKAPGKSIKVTAGAKPSDVFVPGISEVQQWACRGGGVLHLQRE